MTESCLECHEPIAAQFDAGTGLHGSLGRERALLCALCHSEHHGEDFALVNRQSFAQAGADPARFDHAIVGWRMYGRHLEQKCRDCHENADVAILPEGPRILRPRVHGRDFSLARLGGPSTAQEQGRG